MTSEIIKDKIVEEIFGLHLSPSEKMDLILKKTDKFDTIKVIMEILCKELEIPTESHPRVIFDNLTRVTREYHKAMEEFKKFRLEATEMAKKEYIRQ